MKRPLDVLLDELCEVSGRLAAEAPALASLYYLSGLEAEDMVRVREVWPTLPVELRRQLVTRMVELAEADFEADFGAIFRMELEDEDAEIRAAAVEGLWEDEDVRLIPLLAGALRSDEAVAVRVAAAVSLGRFILLGELQKIRPDPQAMAYQALLAACRDPQEDVEVRRRALESLAYVNNETVAGLIQKAYDAPDEKVGVSAVFAMGRSVDTRWASHVRRKLFSPNPELRYEAAHACGELQISEAVAELEELADDADPEVQEAALWALGQIGGDRARRILERYCQTGDEATQAAAETALDELEFLHGDLADLFGRLAKESEW